MTVTVAITETNITATASETSVAVSVASSPISVSVASLDPNSHAAVTLDVNADTLLSLSTQALGLDTQTANRVFSGPSSGAAAVPTFRTLVAGDIPALSYEPVDATIVRTGQANYIDLTDGGATTLHSHAGGGGTWGSITGTLSAQTDLQTALDAKQDDLTFPIAASLGGTGIANGASATLTLPNLAITIGGGGAAQTYTLPAAGGTFALLNAANVFTENQTISNTAPSLTLTDTTASAKSLTIALDSNLVQIRESADAANARLVIDLANVRVGIGTQPFSALDVAGNGSFRLGTPRTTNTNKTGQISLITYAGNTIFTMLAAQSTSTNNIIQYGGGFGGVRATTQLQFWTAADNVTDVGSERMRIDSVGNLGLGVTAPLVRAHIRGDTTTTNAVLEVQRIEAIVSTAATGGAAGFGVGQSFYAETATEATYQQQGLISTSWIDATNATRKAKMSLSAYDTAARLGIEIEASGTEAKLGFYGVATITRAILATGAGATVDNVITALQNLGLVKQA